MKLNELYKYAKKQDIDVFAKHLSVSKGLAIDYKNIQAIALDTHVIANEAEEKRVLSEEIAHLESGLVYALQHFNSPFYRNVVSKIEVQARHISATRLIPFDELKKAVQEDHCCEIWQIAEYFQVSNETVVDAIEYYKSMEMTITIKEDC